MTSQHDLDLNTRNLRQLQYTYTQRKALKHIPVLDPESEMELLRPLTIIDQGPPHGTGFPPVIGGLRELSRGLPTLIPFVIAHHIVRSDASSLPDGI